MRIVAIALTMMVAHAAAGPILATDAEPANSGPSRQQRGCGHGEGGQGHCGHGEGRHGEGGHGAGRHGPHRPEMKNAMTLVHNHERIERTVELIDGGVRTRTTTKDPELLAVLRRHPAEMEAVLDSGGRVRSWDPLFAELAERRDEVELEWREIDAGIEVEVTSADPGVTELIRAHARKVTEFVQRGPAAAHEPTSLPEGYTR